MVEQKEDRLCLVCIRLNEGQIENKKDYGLLTDIRRMTLFMNINTIPDFLNTIEDEQLKLVVQKNWFKSLEKNDVRLIFT